ncbi:winged helix-turn-helix transcriptional regulator [Lysinibacillus piscis]|uniref:Transcriptional regulator n=1 Tax=Lysinibacillus piscis TaxID=2518931 RepID=A0ABQ5NMV8_9BACI|nr:helix-turn-helix domain-containing protein [Lysinibacillus sp. KH24]GLC89679.1 transcriptional regulator [Lysinibacillus sp. KH24]
MKDLQNNNNPAATFACPVAVTVDVIGGKWKGVILYHLISGPKRFNELKRIIADITQRMLTLQLRELERDGIVHREIYQQIPPKVEYSLTNFGETLKPIICLMKDWGIEHEHEILMKRKPQNNE